MAQLESFIWRTQGNVKVRMVDMDAKHLMAAHTYACEKEYFYHNRGNTMTALRDKLEKVAEFKGIELKYPDERFPDKPYGKFFCAIRQCKAVVPEKMEVTVEATLASNR